MNIKPKKVQTNLPLKHIFGSETPREKYNIKEAPFLYNQITTQDTIYKTTQDNNTIETKDNDFLNIYENSSILNEHLPQELKIENSTDNKVHNVENKNNDVDNQKKTTIKRFGDMNLVSSKQYIHNPNQKSTSNRSFLTNNINTKNIKKRKFKESPRSIKSEIIIINERRKSKLLGEQNFNPEKKIKHNEINSSDLSQKEEEFIKKLQGRIVTKGDEIVLSLQNVEKERNLSLKETNQQKKYSIDEKKGKNSYQIVRELDNLVVNRQAHFLERMYFDIFKRRTKEERLLAMVNKNKKKSPEKNIINTFNRLIEDANRRLETKQNIEIMSTLLLKSNIKSPKKYSEKEWDKFYKERFIEPEEKKKKINEDLYRKKMELEKEKEEKIIAERKVLKAPKEYVNRVVERIYDDCIRRKNIKETCSHSHYNTIDIMASHNKSKSKSKSKNNFNSINNTIISTELPITLKSQKDIPRYNFTDADLQETYNDSMERSYHKKTFVSNCQNHNKMVKKTILENSKLNQSKEKARVQLDLKKVNVNSGYKKPSTNKHSEKNKISSYLEEFRICAPKPCTNENIITNHDLKINDFKISKRNMDKKYLTSKYITDANAWKVVDTIIEKNLEIN